MFRGIAAVSLDAKGRMAIPARYRLFLEKTAGQLVVTIDTEDPCLLLYTLTEWELLETKIESLPSFNRAVRRVQRLLIGHATELEIDGAGRILLPGLLRDYAQLQKQVVLVGQGKKFEIWSESIWDQRRSDWIDESMGSNNDKEFPVELLQLVI